MKTRMTAEDAAGLIFDVLADASATGLSKRQIIDATGLTDKQFLNGKAWLRTTLCSEKEEPYSFDPVPTGGVYHLNADFAPVEAYWLYRLRIAAVQLQRLLDGTASPAKAKFGGKKIARMYRHTESLVLDLQDIIAE